MPKSRKVKLQVYIALESDRGGFYESVYIYSATLKDFQTQNTSAYKEACVIDVYWSGEVDIHLEEWDRLEEQGYVHADVTTGQLIQMAKDYLNAQR